MFVFKMILPSMHGYKEFLNYVPDSCHNSQSLEFFREHAPLQNNAACYRNIIQFRYLLNSNGMSTAFSIDNPVSRRVSLFRQKPLNKRTKVQNIVVLLFLIQLCKRLLFGKVVNMNQQQAKTTSKSTITQFTHSSELSVKFTRNRFKCINLFHIRICLKVCMCSVECLKNFN